MTRVNENLMAALAILVALLFTGCASTGSAKPPRHTVPQSVDAAGDMGWWHVRYGIHWPENTEPAWNVDMMLADSVVAPVLDRHRRDIILWRFHRRASRDAAGHQFSFIFYSSPQRAGDVMEDLQANRTLKTMKNQGLIIRENYDATLTVTKPKMEDTSDSKWSHPVQKAWPYFIMGVSEMWLRLIQDARGQIQGDKHPESIAAMLDTYGQVNKRIIETWRDEGRHAFLHHLNALFGYEPLVVYERKMMGF